MRLIDADALKEIIGCADAVKYGNKTAEQQHNSYSAMMMYEIADAIDDMPTVDAEPVRHGRWVQVDEDTWECSACGVWWTFIADGPEENGARRCPVCGAKLDGDDEK